MRLGCIAPLEHAAAVAAAGFEYIECPVTALKPAEPDSDFAAVRTAFRACPLPVPAFNLFIPAELKIVGPAVDEARQRSYARVAIERVAAVGARVIVLGSGPARTIPDGFPRARAEDQFIGFARYAGGVAAAAGVVIALESIASGGGVNFINTFREAAEIAERVGSPAVKVVADLGQMAPGHEPWSHLSEYGRWIAHAHLFDTDKKVPGSGSLPWPEALSHLRRSGYDGAMSVECRWADLAPVAAQVVHFVRKAWEATA